MATCPNKSAPAWRELVEMVGEEKAHEEYVKNGNKIPKLNGYIDNHIYDINGPKFNSTATIDNLNNNPEFAKEILDKLKEIMPDVRIYEEGLFDKNGKWLKIPAGKQGMHYRNLFVGAVAWANDAEFHIPPHEYAHEYIEMFKNHPVMKKAVELYGVEGLADKMGKDFVNNLLSPKEKNLVERLWDFIRNFFGAKDVGDIISENFYKGKKLSENVHQGNAQYNFAARNKPWTRTKGAVSTDGKFDDSSIELTMIDDTMATDYIMRAMAGSNVFTGIETVLDEVKGIFREKPIGKTDANRAALVFSGMKDIIIKLDKDPMTGKYANRAGLSLRQLNDFSYRMRDSEHVMELLQVLQGNKEVPPQDNSTALSQDYWLAMRMMKKINYVQKAQNSIIADDNKMVSKYAVKERVQEEIERTQAQRRESLEKRFKSKKLVNFIDNFQKFVNWGFITPYLTAKYLAGDGSFFQQLYYKGLDQANTVKLDILSKFSTKISLSKEKSKKLGAYSAFMNPDLDIEVYKGKEFSFVIDDKGVSQKVKLTDAEILSLYLTLKQTGQQGIFPDSPTPAQALAKEGFMIDKIKGRKGLNKTNYKFGVGTEQAIINYIESNEDFLDITKNVREALDGLFIPLSKTFRQQNGFALPQYENYYPVTTFSGAWDMKTQLNSIENFMSIRERVGPGMPLYISDVNKVLSFHSNQASSYAAYAIPIDNNRKIIKMLNNEFAGSEDEYKFVMQLLRQAEGKLNQLNDPSMLTSSQGEKVWMQKTNKVMSNFAVSVLSWNFPVNMKQPVSYLAAKEEIDTKYLRQAGWGIGGIAGISFRQILKSIKYTGVRKGESILPFEWEMDMTNPIYKDIVKYSPQLKMRFEGAVSKELGEAMFEKHFGQDKITLPGIKKKDGSRYEVSKARLMEGIKVFDGATVMAIWKAVELEASELQPQLTKGSEEYYEHIASRTEHIVNMTQPTFDLMNRTNLSSSTNPLARTVTMFGSARSKLGALMLDGIYDVLANPTKENKNKLYKRSFNLMVLNALALATVNALAAGFNLKDDDEPWYDKEGDGWLDDAGQWTKYQMINNAFSQFYFASELSRYVTTRLDDAPWSYDMINPVEGIANDGMKAFFNIVRIGKTDKRTGDWSFTIDDGLLEALDVTTKVIGLPNKAIKVPEKAGIKIYNEYFAE